MTRAIVLSVLAVAAAAVAVAAQSSPCQVQLTTPYTATFDMTSIQASTAATICGETAWFSEDLDDQVGETIDYYFCYNFCQNLAQPPISNGKCPTSPLGNVYQLYNNTQTGQITNCHIVSYAQNLTWALLDDVNPAMGIVQTYGGGDVCYATGLPRDITIELHCKPSGALPTFSAMREDQCSYSLRVDSLAACPLECPRVNEQLCNGHGVCGGDDDLGRVRCFCNSGWSGDDCASSGSSSSSGSSHATSVLVAFVIILVIALLIMSVVLWRKIKRLNADDSRYGQLTDDAAPRRPNTAAGMTAATAGASAVPSAVDSHKPDDHSTGKLVNDNV